MSYYYSKFQIERIVSIIIFYFLKTLIIYVPKKWETTTKGENFRGLPKSGALSDCLFYFIIEPDTRSCYSVWCIEFFYINLQSSLFWIGTLVIESIITFRFLNFRKCQLIPKICNALSICMHAIVLANIAI